MGDKEVYGRKEKNNGRIKAKSTEERIKKWKDQFLNVLGQPLVTRSKEKSCITTHSSN